jgi:membrane fusion protein (multidrug efflux system)
LFRRHFFLIAAIAVVVAMGVAGTLKVLSKKPAAGPGGAGAAAGGPAGGRGGAAGGAGGPGSRGGAGGGALVAATSVTQRIFTDRLDVQGVAKGRQSVTLTATGGQVVDRVLFKSGDRVKKGQILLELRKDAEDAGIAQAQAVVDLAKSTADRWNKLAAQGLAPAATAEQYQSAYITAEGSLDAAKARLKDRVINAPFTGIIGLSDIAPGALISPGTAIATLDDTSVMIVDIDIPDRNLAIVKEGTAIDATSDSYPGEHYAGKIAKIDTRIDERSRSFKARAELPNPGDRLKPGMLLHVGIDRGTHQALAAPEAAVQYSAGQASVYLITPRGGNGGGGANAGGGAATAPGGQPSGAAAGAPAGGRPGGGGGGGFIALQRPIVAGIDECGFVEVKDGLALGDRIVADGLNKLTPNQPITLGGGRGGRGGPGAAGGERGGSVAGAAGAAAGAGGPRGQRSGASGRPDGDQAAAGPAGGRRGGGEARGRGPGAGPNVRGGVQPAIAGGAASRCATPQSTGRGGPAGPGGEGKGRGRGNGDGAPADAQAPGGGPARAGRRGVETAQ